MKTILLCEPNNSKNKVERILQKSSYRCIICDDIDDVLQLFHKNNADLLLLSAEIATEDLAMLRESIRCTNKTVPILFFDVSGSFALLNQISLSCIDDYVLFGSSKKELLWRIRGLLKQSQSMRNQP